MRYKEWLDEWLEYDVRVSTKERTYGKYRRETAEYILPALGEYDLGELTAVRLRKFAAELSGRGLAANTVSGILSVLKRSLRKAVEYGVADSQHADAIALPRGRQPNAACFRKSEQKKIEKYVLAANTPYLFGILLALYTGLRIGELLALTWDDVDFRKGTLSVVRSCYDRWENGKYVKVMGTTKTRCSERVIPVPKPILACLRSLRKSAHSRFVVEGKGEYGAEVRSYQRTFARVLGKLGIARKGFHALRHTFATRAIECGMDVRTLSEILGHGNPTITLQRYAHSLLEHKTEMMNRVGRLFG